MTQKGKCSIVDAAEILKIRYSTACDIMVFYRATGRLYRSDRDQKRSLFLHEYNKSAGKKRKLIVTIEVPD